MVADFWPYFSGSSIWKFLAWCTMSDPSCYKCFIRHRVVFYSKHASEHEFTMNLPPSGILIAISCKLRFLGERANSSANFVKLISRMSWAKTQINIFIFHLWEKSLPFECIKSVLVIFWHCQFIWFVLINFGFRYQNKWNWLTIQYHPIYDKLLTIDELLHMALPGKVWSHLIL